jgi:hypothetical protein
MVLKDVIAAIDVARAAMKIIPVIGSRLEGGIEVLLLLCKHAEVGCNSELTVLSDRLVCRLSG